MEHMYRMLCVQLIDAMTSLVTVNGVAIYIMHTDAGISEWGPW